MRIKLIILVLFVSFSFYSVGENGRKNFRIVSYNVENYFDLVNDSTTADEEYLPGGMRSWNNDKYRTKQGNIAKVITAIGQWQPPAVVGLCEVESDKALSDLTRYSPLKNLNYQYIHYESSDFRGIDVALLYQKDQFKPLYSEPIAIQYEGKPFKTRDILYVNGIIVETNDTLHLFVCHMPSRLGGEMESESKRINVAQHIRNKVNDIYSSSATPNIVIMGDFNDHPSNKSMVETLDANPLNEGFENDKLYNLAFRLEEKGKGTHKFQGEWGMLDQIIVSGVLLNPNQNVRTTPDDLQIFDADFLLETDNAFLGKMPKRTYIGMKYNDGFSDHLPIYIDLWYD